MSEFRLNAVWPRGIRTFEWFLKTGLMERRRKPRNWVSIHKQRRYNSSLDLSTWIKRTTNRNWATKTFVALRIVNVEPEAASFLGRETTSFVETDYQSIFKSHRQTPLKIRLSNKRLCAAQLNTECLRSGINDYLLLVNNICFWMGCLCEVYTRLIWNKLKKIFVKQWVLNIFTYVTCIK